MGSGRRGVVCSASLHRFATKGVVTEVARVGSPSGSRRAERPIDYRSSIIIMTTDERGSHGAVDISLTEVPPFKFHSASLEPVTTTYDDSMVTIMLIQARRQKLSKQGEMHAMKLWCQISREHLLQSDRLSSLIVPTPEDVSADNGDEALHVVVPDDSLNIESIAQALRWQSLPSKEREEIHGHVTWQSMCGLLQASAWLGCSPLLSACESRLCDMLCLDNVVPVARAAERASALRLLTAAFFLLKAYFCADVDSLERPVRTTANALPRLGPQGIRQGSYAFPHHGWRDVIRGWRARGAAVRNAQPCYTLCTLTRERTPGQPSVFRLVSEHDGRLLLVARQRYAVSTLPLLCHCLRLRVGPSTARVHNALRAALPRRPRVLHLPRISSRLCLQRYRLTTQGEGDFLIFGLPEEEERRQSETKELAEAANREEEAREEEAERKDLDELSRKYEGAVGSLEEGEDEEEDDKEEREMEGKEGEEKAEAATGGGGEGGAGGAGGDGGGEGGEGAASTAEPAPQLTPAQLAARERRQRRKQRERERKERVEKIATLEAELRKARADAFVESIASADAEALPEHAACFRGCLTSRWLGLHFSLYDGGLKAEHVSKGFPFPPREELCAVAYASNVMKSRPHSMTIVLRDTDSGYADEMAAAPGVVSPGSGASGKNDGSGGGGDKGGSAGGGSNVRSPSRSIAHEAVAEIVGDIDTTSMRTAAASILGGGSGSLLERKMSGKLEGLHILNNQMPDWDPKLEAYTLPFYQRVSLPSKKNVHIVRPEAPDDIVLLFGKRQKSEDGTVTTFSLDFCRPMSTLTAFATALTSFFGSE